MRQDHLRTMQPWANCRTTRFQHGTVKAYEAFANAHMLQINPSDNPYTDMSFRLFVHIILRGPNWLRR